MNKKWEKQIDPINKYGVAFILGDRGIKLTKKQVRLLAIYLLAQI